MTRVMDRADTLKPGDWTFYAGFRPVAAVRVFPRRRQVRVVLSDGQARTFSCAHPVMRRVSS